MPLDKILQALESEAERQIAEIGQAADAEIARIRGQAQAEAAAAQHKHMPAIQAPLRAEQARILNRAKLEALKVVMGAREALIASALDAAACQLEALADSEAYARLLRQLTREAIETLAVDGQVCLRVRSRDMALMKAIAQEMGLSVEVEGGLEHDTSSRGSLGGVVITTPDGRITLVNTLHARLQRVASLYRSQIAEGLFAEPRED